MIQFADHLVICCPQVRVKEEITEYSMVDLIRDRIVNTCPLDLPPSVFDTVGFVSITWDTMASFCMQHAPSLGRIHFGLNRLQWCDIPQDVIQKFTGHAGMMREALSALALVMRALLPALTMSAHNDRLWPLVTKPL